MKLQSGQEIKILGSSKHGWLQIQINDEENLDNTFADLKIEEAEILAKDILNRISSDYSSSDIVPFQLCPKCNGDGEVMVLNFYGSPTGLSAGPTVCPVCKGERLIPMSKK